MASVQPQSASAPKLRCVIESDRFRKEREAIDHDTARLDEVLDGFVRIVAADPSCGKRTEGPGILGLAATNFRKGEQLIVYYSCPDDDHVVLESIIRSPSDD